MRRVGAGASRARPELARPTTAMSASARSGASRARPELAQFSLVAFASERWFGSLNGVVSIHAPAWGATSDELDDAVQEAVSIHAPAWGATGRSGLARRLRRRFDPRARMGRDFSIAGLRAGLAGFRSTRPHGARPVPARSTTKPRVSIHAPAWGATSIGARIRF